MTKHLLKIALPLAAAAALTGCVGGGGEPLTAATTSAVLSEMEDMTDMLGTSNTVPTGALPGGISTSGVQTQAVDCETTSGDLSDTPDADGIAAKKISTFSCSDFASTTHSYTRSGTITIEDLDSTLDGMAGGLKITYNNVKFEDTQTGGDYYLNTYTGSWQYKNYSGVLKSSMDLSGRSRYKNGSHGYDTDYLYSYLWNYSLKPTNTSSEAVYWNGGTVNFDATFAMSGKLNLEDANGKHFDYDGSWQIKFYGKNLVYASGCAQFYDSGSFVLEDGGGNTLEIRYACTTAKYYVNGVESDLYTP